MGQEVDYTIKYPTQVKVLHQIEITSRCNLQCKYCLQPYLTRKKEDMSEETFIKAVTAASYFASLGWQRELWLHGLGESTIHRDFIKFLGIAREYLPNMPVRVSTNAIGVTEDTALALKEYRIPVHISLHRPDLAHEGIFILKKHGLIEEMSINPIVNATDWAGQIEWESHVEASKCGWVANGWCIVLADGRVSMCCSDGNGEEIIGHVDDIYDLKTGPRKLCEGCHLTVPDKYDELRTLADHR